MGILFFWFIVLPIVGLILASPFILGWGVWKGFSDIKMPKKDPQPDLSHIHIGNTRTGCVSKIKTHSSPTIVKIV